MKLYRTNISSLLACAGFAFTVALVGVEHEASAQPSPYSDYAALKRGETPPAVEGAVVEPDTVLPYQKGIWMLGLRSAFSYTGALAQSLTGPSETTTTFFFRLAPTLQLHVIDKLALGVSFGLLGKSQSREEDRSRSEIDWLTEVTAHYTIPITSRFALTPGVGLGFYFGGSDRNLQKVASGPLVEESTSTRGFAGALYLDVAYQVAKNLQLRSGLGFFGSVGSESLEDVPQNLTTTAFNITLPVEVHYTF